MSTVREKNRQTLISIFGKKWEKNGTFDIGYYELTRVFVPEVYYFPHSVYKAEHKYFLYLFVHKNNSAK